MKQVLYSQIEDLGSDIDSLKDQFLRQHGWEHACDSPGAYWLWKKTLPDGRFFNCDRGTAISIQNQLTCTECGKDHEKCTCDPAEGW